MRKDICVFVQISEGQPSRISLEAISVGRTLADRTGGKVIAIILDEQSSAITDKLIVHGADCVVALVSTGLDNSFSSDDISIYMLEQAACSLKPAVMVFGGTTIGKAQTARLAARIKAGYVADVKGLSIENDAFVWKHFAYSGSLLQKERIVTECAVISIRSGAFKKLEPDASRQGITQKIEISAKDLDVRTRIAQTIQTMGEEVNIEDAEVVICAGRGIGDQKTFQRLLVLANLMNGVVGGTRPVVEAGWVPRSQQIGQSGKTIAPHLYIAFGVSGAIQHLSGITGANYIVAVNKDEEAPIFEIADIGIVGDAKEALEVMIEEIEKMKS